MSESEISTVDVTANGTDKLPAPIQSANEKEFGLIQRKAQALASSGLVPKEYQNNVPNCMIAMELADRTGSATFMVMQNVHIIQGRPSWSSQFIIGALNSCGRFSPIRFTKTGEPGAMDRTYMAVATDLSSGAEIEGPPVSLQMAKDEGWSTKNGSKWKTLPELMLSYRAAAFFGRLYAPDVLMGMHTIEEVTDFLVPEKPSAAAALDSLKDVTPEKEPEPKEKTTTIYQDEPPEDWEPQDLDLGKDE